MEYLAVCYKLLLAPKSHETEKWKVVWQRCGGWVQRSKSSDGVVAEPKQPVFDWYLIHPVEWCQPWYSVVLVTRQPYLQDREINEGILLPCLPKIQDDLRLKVDNYVFERVHAFPIAVGKMKPFLRA